MIHGDLDGVAHSGQEGLCFLVATLSTKTGKEHPDALGSGKREVMPGRSLAVAEEPSLTVRANAESKSRNLVAHHLLTSGKTQGG